jgi:hypothetical protein
MRLPKPAPGAVARLLERLATMTASMWSPAALAAVRRASTLAAFTNFPIGLLRLPGDTASLAARVPVTYQPLLPLTRTVQMELSYQPLVDLSTGVRVLLAECIPQSDPVGTASRRGWTQVEALLSSAGKHMTFDRVETLSTRALRQAIQSHRPEIAIISAHGILSNRRDAAGLQIGGDLVLGSELGPMPPVVILSACHVAPRGAGTVSVADLLLREGAIAVLGTQVPIDVNRNTLLTMRFLTSIAVVLEGEPQYGQNLLDVWRYVQISNAVLDVLSGNKSLDDWGRRRAPSGRTVLEEFMTSRSMNRVGVNDIYADTESVLAEIADDMGVGREVRNWFRNPGYVPESLFYAFAGRPDRIHLASPMNPPGFQD